MKTPFALTPILVGLLVLLAFAVGSAFAQESHTVTVNSVPAGASVSVNGRRVGKTPVELVVSQGAKLDATVELPGYKPQTLNLEANPNSPIEIMIQLELDDASE